MAQLSDDCFAFGGKLLAVDAALALIAEDTQPIDGTEHVARTLIQLSGQQIQIVAHRLLQQRRRVFSDSHRQCRRRLVRNPLAHALR